MGEFILYSIGVLFALAVVYNAISAALRGIQAVKDAIYAQYMVLVRNMLKTHAVSVITEEPPISHPDFIPMMVSNFCSMTAEQTDEFLTALHNTQGFDEAWADYLIPTCKKCKGTGSHNGAYCPDCNAVGKRVRPIAKSVFATADPIRKTKAVNTPFFNQSLKKAIEVRN